MNPSGSYLSKRASPSIEVSRTTLEFSPAVTDILTRVLSSPKIPLIVFTIEFKTPTGTLFPPTTYMSALLMLSGDASSYNILMESLSEVSTSAMSLLVESMLVSSGKDEFFRVDITCNKAEDRKSTRLNSSHQKISYAVFCL